MSSPNSTKLNLSKAELQILVTLNDPSVSFTKPKNKRSECWSNFSQIYHENNPLDYIICLQCKSVLKWTSENGTRVMSHHNCLNKFISTTPSRQRTISSYYQQSSASKECPLFQKCITEASVEYCGIDCRPFESIAGVGFMNLAKQLIIAGAHILIDSLAELIWNRWFFPIIINFIYWNRIKSIISDHNRFATIFINQLESILISV
ncbi:unnamed protein product [Rotaria sordida]|uniref:BED-type domain-containing protein n=1 Tax=Rotaria sordida TaxID=392033 RepID=A0A815PHW0_9BILA|nr:unnamed protein product [Rotaria sordida]CAF1449855.1 unnamed protein product [Rotaria sordida]CAF3917711.1 unnamed protein product [Rotaria sordida]CAF4024406.1 unnamed protein product [Rotaria sordida]